jgi:energy-coupling factor transporter ATP-binding protein EcfA2
MRLLKARITGFQSIGETAEVHFDEGINLVIGQNNSGKSSLLRALLPNLPDDRHRTPERWQAHRLRGPEVALTFEASGSEIRDWALRSASNLLIPVPVGTQVTKYVERLFASPSLQISGTRQAAQAGLTSAYPSHGLFVPGQQFQAAMLHPHAGDLNIDGPVNNGGDSLPGLLWEAWQRDMFYFAAERMNVGEASFGYANRLEPDARNLPNVLDNLIGERGDIFQQLVDHLREIFPTVGNLSVRIKPPQIQGPQEVLVWPTTAMLRPELSFPLANSGTGVAQVIALLTAIMTIDKAIIIIDEISTFLHPAAVKSLLRILQTQYLQHQYIISTHSAEVIAFGNPKTIHLIKRSGYESTVERLDPGNVTTFRNVAAHLGVSMADVFAAEKVIWVEGQTEELCFPYIYRELLGRPVPRGIIFTSVAATGDFHTNKRNASIVYEVYERLSAAVATLPVAVVFSFDTEKLSERDKGDMRARSRGRLHFLPRRHFECYLVDPIAIAAFIISKDAASSDVVTPAAVEDALRVAAAAGPLHIREWNGDITDTAWLDRVDAANLIDSVCGTLSEQRARFDKTDDSLFLLRHILERDRAHLEPLRQYIESLVTAVFPVAAPA